jgi:hypothetical protein
MNTGEYGLFSVHKKILAGVGIGFPGRVGILFSDPVRVVIRPRAYIIRAWSVTQMTLFGRNAFGSKSHLGQIRLGQMPRNSETSGQ